MNSFQNRLYIATFLSGAGSWLTLIGTAMLVQERFGIDKVPYAFLLNGLPVILFGPRLSKLIPDNMRAKFFIYSQILLALNVASLVFSQSSIHVFTYIFIAATLNSVANPCLQSLISDHIDQANMAPALRKIGALDASSLVFAPALGGYIASHMGFGSLFVIDAATFFIAATLLYAPDKKSTIDNAETVEKDSIAPRTFLSDFSIFFKNQTHLNKNTISWILLMALAALLNGIEFSIFRDHGLNKESIGWALTFWGLGNSLPLLIGKNLDKKSSHLAFFMSLSFTLFIYGPGSYAIYVASTISGFLFVLLMSNIRASIQNELGTGKSNLVGWALINMRTRLASISVYLLCAFWLKYLNPSILYLGLILVPLTIYLLLKSKPVTHLSL